ncbi:RNA-binding domain-containing protein, partial [Hygrophoropsis aurantiaca]
VFAGNLAYTTTDEGLKAFFAPVQEDILSASVILRGTRSAGYGFVSLSTAAAADKAVAALDSQELDGRKIIVELAKPAEAKAPRTKEGQDGAKKEKKAKRRPGRRGAKAVPGEVSEAEANGSGAGEPAAEGGEGEGATDEAAKPKKKKKARKPKRKTPAGDASQEAPADSTAPADETATPPKKEKAARPKKPRAPRPRPTGEPPAGTPSKSMLFVANLGFTTDDAGLAALFTDVGVAVVSARVVRRRWGTPRRSKGYGFVDVGGEEEQARAIELVSGQEVEGRAVVVKVAVNAVRDEEGDAAEDKEEAVVEAAPEAA